MRNIENKVVESLFSMQDLEYKRFHAKLIPNVDEELVIGVRTPALRKFAKDFAKTDEAKEFIQTLPHKYYEENNLHGFILEQIKDYDECIAEVERFLPYVDNWATCDLMSPKIFQKNRVRLLEKIKVWIKSDDTYTIRFAIEMLMKYFLDDTFDMVYPKMVSEVKSDEYYVNMMIAWYFATALAKQYDWILPFIENKKLDKWTHNKAIQKAVESRRIAQEQKDYLRTLKMK
ncbi:MAG: DNA alkylation repair protein [Eubacterium sp.]|nr:DNA alkylation repair protein [Eubacterium sp.]